MALKAAQDALESPAARASLTSSATAVAFRSPLGSTNSLPATSRAAANTVANKGWRRLVNKHARE